MDYGFELPDVVFDLPAEERRRRMSGGRRLCLLDGERGFVRSLLPVRLDVGSVQFGLWLEIDADAYAAARAVWDEPQYADLRLTGAVANLLEPWGAALLGARAEAAVRDVDALPYVVAGDAVVTSLLDDVWSRAAVVGALPGLGHGH